MADLIDRDAVLRKINGYIADGYFDGSAESADELCYEIERIPAADAAPVVRCKECKNFMFNNDEKYGLCDFYDGFTHNAMPEDFCSYGERKEQA